MKSRSSSGVGPVPPDRELPQGDVLFLILHYLRSNPTLSSTVGALEDEIHRLGLLPHTTQQAQGGQLRSGTYTELVHIS